MFHDCIFCKIVMGEIPCYKVYEDGDILAFLDINPVNKGHTLVVPKKHSETILDTDDEILAKLIIATRKICKAIIKGMNIKGINIGINNFKEAGQLVSHIHIHIMPRVTGDGYHLWEGKKLPEQEMKAIAEKIKNSL